MSRNSPKVTRVRGPLPGPNSKKLLARWARAEAPTTGYQAQIAVDRAHGCVVHDVDGNRFIDWTSGVLVTNVGHCHPHLVRAVWRASERVLNCYEYPTEYRVRAAEMLVAAAPRHLNTCFFLSTGSEVTDTCIRLMKRKTGAHEIIGFYGAFHGRTYAPASAGGMLKPKRGNEPTMPGVLRAPYPYCYRCPFRAKVETCGFLCLEFLDEVVRANSCGDLAGVITEPYQGTSGFVFPPKGWMPALEKWIRARKLLFTLDEVQSSYGRTGTMWAMDHEGLTPDLVAVGKGIGSGITTAALLARRSVVRVVGRGEMSSTSGGNPVSCAAVCAVLEIMEREKLADNARRIGKLMKDRLVRVMDKARHLGDVRGMGLVMGLELVRDKRTREPAPELARKVIDRCAAKGLLVGSVGLYGNVIRVAPPLVITESEADESLDIMERVLVSL